MKYLTSFAVCFIITFIGCALIVKTTGDIDGFVLTILLGQSTITGLMCVFLRWSTENKE